jgi:hypothetical protein
MASSTNTRYVAYIDNTNGPEIVVGVNEKEIIGVREAKDDEGNKIDEPEYGMGATVAMPEVSTGILIGSGYDADRMVDLARDILADRGWHTLGELQVADSAYCIDVERY